MRIITDISQDIDGSMTRYLKQIICNKEFLLVILKIEPIFFYVMVFYYNFFSKEFLMGGQLFELDMQIVRKSITKEILDVVFVILKL